MKELITLEYNPEDGWLYDANGDQIYYNGIGVAAPRSVGNAQNLESIKELRRAGFSADDIIAFHKNGLIK